MSKVHIYEYTEDSIGHTIEITYFRNSVMNVQLVIRHRVTCSCGLCSDSML